MGVEHTQPEKGRKLVIDIGGGSTEMVIGEDFEPLLVESRRMGCVSFAQQFSLVVKSARIISDVRVWPRHKVGKSGMAIPDQGWQYALGASGTIKATYEVLVEMGEKTV